MSMSTRHLTESAVNLIISTLKANIAAALADIRINRNDNTISMEVPKDYFIYPKAQGYKAPAVFVIGDNIDFRKRELGANHINCTIRVNLTVLVEDRDADRITKKAYRYQSALSEVLDQQGLTTADNEFKMWVVIQRAAYSPLYSNATDVGQTDAVYRKEVSLELDCYAVEQL